MVQGSFSASETSRLVEVTVSIPLALSVSSKTPRSTSSGESGGAMVDARFTAASSSARLMVMCK